MNPNYLRYRLSTAAREVAYFPLDMIDLVAGNRPPERKIFVRSQLDAAGLVLQEPVRCGSWSGARHYLSCQDIIIATKE